jgi:glycosyltransferase involved in cell wall biosynthesis
MLGAAVTTIGLSRRTPNPWRLVRLARSIRASEPEVIQTWLPAADFLGGLLGRLTTRAPVVWNIRMSEHRPGRWSWQTRLVVRLNGLLSRLVPTKIVAVASKAADIHAQVGFDRRRIVVIHNGFEPSADVPHRANARSELGIPQDALVACRLARFHPDKDFPTLLHAWKQVAEREPQALLAIAGHGTTRDNAELMSIVSEAAVESSVVLLGHMANPTVLYDASDVTVSSSLEEGLPNVIGEAMARGLPAVVTDVGDSALLVGDTGQVVEPAQPASLATALLSYLHMTADARHNAGARARERVVQQFSMEAMADRYIALWAGVANVRH